MVFIFVFLMEAMLNAQNYRLKLSHNPLNIKTDLYTDSLNTLQSLNRIRNIYLLNSYLEFNIDSIRWLNDTVFADIHTGPVYKMNHIQLQMDSNEMAFQNLQNKYLFNGYDTNKVAKLAEEILQNLENNGYPFCQVNAKISYMDSGVDVQITIERGPVFIFDSLHIDGELIVKKRFIEAYTGIRMGHFYNEALFRKAHDKLMQLPFLYSERTPQLVFMKNGKARPYYYLRKKKSDQLNGIIGLAPNTQSVNIPNSRSVVFTGEFTLRLNNLFKSAKVLSIQWKSFQARSQELKTYFSFPYILYKPIGMDVGIDLLKYDTLYTVLQKQVSFQYYTSGINCFKAFYKVSNTNLNSVDTNLIRNSKQFPSSNSIQIKQYGLMANFTQLDYKFNPRKGYQLESSASVGFKQILRDNLISEVRFGPNQYNLYDSSTLTTNQYQYQMKFDFYLPIESRSTIKFGVSVSQIIADQIYFNELQREGGINSLKGFNEQSIFASNFNMLELEYRYLLGLNSHFKVFWNGAYYEDKRVGRNDQVFDMPWGFGIGGNIETGAGILTLAYALGKQKGNNFDVRTGKFHFGISSYF